MIRKLVFVLTILSLLIGMAAITPATSAQTTDQKRWDGADDLPVWRGIRRAPFTPGVVDLFRVARSRREFDAGFSGIRHFPGYFAPRSHGFSIQCFRFEDARSGLFSLQSVKPALVAAGGVNDIPIRQYPRQILFRRIGNN